MIGATVLALAASFTAGMTSPPLSDAIQRVDPIEYRVQLKGSIGMRASAIARTCPRTAEAPLHVPLPREGAYHRLDPSRLHELLPALLTDGRPTSRTFEVVAAPGVGDYAKIAAYGCQCSKVEFTIDAYLTAYSAKVDDAALAQCAWTEEWPTDVRAALGPQMYIESTNEQVVRLMNQWTSGRAKSVTPYFLGKELARRVTQVYRPGEANVVYGRRHEITGINVNGAIAAMKSGRGSLHDLVCLLVCLYVAVCRAAGLPARPVIGVDYGDYRRERGRNLDCELISWAEFFVPDAGWVSVDFRSLYRAPGTMRNINDRWPGFASDQNLNRRIPLAYHYHAPLIHLSTEPVEKPLLWTWHSYPEAVVIDQSLDIHIDRQPRTGSSGR